MDLIELLKRTVELGGADLFIIPGSVPKVKVKGIMKELSDERIIPENSEKLVEEMSALAHRDIALINRTGDDDFSFAVKDLSRFRCNAYKQRGTLAAACRVVSFGLPKAQDLMIPKQVMDLIELREGMVLVTGPTGSGKSTTLACMVDAINSSRSDHIVTIEDPIEYLHRHKMSLVSQREIPSDTVSFASALRAALRQAPDVIMLGEMRDRDTIRTAITAAETGHLVLSSLHTSSAATSVDRIIDSFEASQQAQVRLQLSMVLRAVISQRLIPSVNGDMIPAFEVMTANTAIQNLIRDGRTHQIDNTILASHGKTMLSLDNELLRLVKEGKISKNDALLSASNADALSKRL